MTQLPSATRAIEFRNATLGATVAVLRETEPAGLADALHKMLGGMPDFFSGEATVLDFGTLEGSPERIDWAGLLSLLRRYQLQPVGVRNLPPDFAEGARRAGLALLDGAELRERQGAPAPAPVRAEPPPPPPAPAPAPISAGTMFVDRPLRSGQQVYARGGDLVVLAGVSNGAEIIADGSIHCYGPLRGRALAGAQGDTSARIVATNFGPELVSIAGVYRTFDKGIPEHLAGRAALVRLTGSANDYKLDLQPLHLD
ncbi:septum site-determining protein MinC [Pseudothauera rhizosphaerae]|uniref:Probable septum site-determining protein MinC n=1 Tax=Pseudothauera rhizosphaerae TaxID=2565932 RepID=A0A4S4ATV3_9RHOO|nr:septum site-determining protein MinC [Pseudothauera rhizosphaerae]THF63357.1 septum site-determining protein MinC [Pseudothauera rhizosphaerae]